MVSTVISASICAHSGCMVGDHTLRGERPTSAWSTSCTWAITGLRSRVPLHCCTYSMASSAWRTAASPMADGSAGRVRRPVGRPLASESPSQFC